jgi:branched-chain amino acid transport system permease protein
LNWPLIFSNAIFTAISVNAIGYALIAQGLNVHFGYTGLLNFGQAAFAAAGAYAVAIPVNRYGWSFWACIPVLITASVVLALLLGIPTLRLRADYLAIVTIAASEIVRISLNSVRFTWLTGGNDGLQQFTGDVSSVNPFSRQTYRFLPQIFGNRTQTFNEFTLFLMLAGWILLALASAYVYYVMRSPWGRVVKSIREDEDAARSLGKNIFSYKMQSLIIGGIIGAFGGVVIAVGNRVAQPNNYSTALTFFAYTILILGGVARVKGPIVGSMIFWFLITFIDNVLSEATNNDKLDWLPAWLNVTDSNFGQVKYIMVGIGLILLVVFRPQGIFGDKREQVFDVR